MWGPNSHMRISDMAIGVWYNYARSKAATHLTTFVLLATVFFSIVQVCFCSTESAAVASLSGFEWWVWRGRQRETVGLEPEEERGRPCWNGELYM